MEKPIFLLFAIDTWHTKTSKRLIGNHMDLGLLVYELGKLDKSMNDYDLMYLKNNWQTQGREVNYLIEHLERNQVYLD